MLLIVMGIYTFALIYTIHKYEESLKHYRESIEDHKRALSIAKNQTFDDHNAWLQIENKRLNKDMKYLSDANDHLQAENKSLRKHNNELLNGGGIQYESSTYKNSLWETPIYKDTEKLIEL